MMGELDHMDLIRSFLDPLTYFVFSGSLYSLIPFRDFQDEA